MKYEDAMNYITEIGKLGSSYGLDRTFRLLELLGSPQEKLKIIHIAGTNGKGSITSMITSLLMGKGFKVGMYTSPYIEEFEERIQINKININKEVLGSLMDELKEAVNKVIEEGLAHPTEFEIITCLMFLYFYKEKVDYAVVEVGLGGRLDSTNVIIPLVSVIASISVDHTNFLGNTLSSIAAEKVGIIKEKVPVISYPQEKEAEEVIIQKANEMKSDLYTVYISNSKFIKVINEEKIYQKYSTKINNEEVEIKLPLLGEHQIKNSLVAINAFKVLCKIENIEFNIEEVKKSLLDVKWMGRLEVLEKRPLVVIDGAHNIGGIKALKENINKYFSYNNMYLLLGILADKEVEEMVKTIVPMAKKVYALTPHSERAELSSDLRQVVLKYNKECEAIEDYKEAYKKVIKEAKDDDLILISGSLYMIGDMRKIIRNNK